MQDGAKMAINSSSVNEIKMAILSNRINIYAQKLMYTKLLVNCLMLEHQQQLPNSRLCVFFTKRIALFLIHVGKHITEIYASKAC